MAMIIGYLKFLIAFGHLKLSNINFDNKKFLDIGSGCGFPGLAYAITHPNSEIYLLILQKKNRCTKNFN